MRYLGSDEFFGMVTLRELSEFTEQLELPRRTSETIKKQHKKGERTSVRPCGGFFGDNDGSFPQR